MKYLRMLWILVIMLCFGVVGPTLFAQDGDFKELVPAKAQLAKRIFLVVDVSGSMTSDGKIKRALEFVTFICQQPLDEYEIAIVVFETKTSRWDGYPCPKDDPKPCPKGWAKLPSADAVKAAQEWLNKFPGTNSTNATAGFSAALEEDRKEMSVVIITDGGFDNCKETLEAIKTAQEAREKKGLGKAVISVFGVGEAAGAEVLKTIAKDYGGGFFMAREKPKKLEKTDEDKKDEPF